MGYSEGAVLILFIKEVSNVEGPSDTYRSRSYVGVFVYKANQCSLSRYGRAGFFLLP